MTRKSRKTKKKGVGFFDDQSDRGSYIEPILYKKSQMETVRQKLGQYVMSLEGSKKIDDK